MLSFASVNLRNWSHRRDAVFVRSSWNKSRNSAVLLATSLNSGMKITCDKFVMDPVLLHKRQDEEGQQKL